MCACTALSQDGFQGRGLWVVGINYFEVALSDFLTSKEPFTARVIRKVSLTWWLRNMWSFISYLGRAQLLSRSCHFGGSVHRGETVPPGFCIFPASLWLAFVVPKEQEEKRDLRAVCGLRRGFKESVAWTPALVLVITSQQGSSLKQR